MPSALRFSLLFAQKTCPLHLFLRTTLFSTRSKLCTFNFIGYFLPRLWHHMDGSNEGLGDNDGVLHHFNWLSKHVAWWNCWDAQCQGQTTLLKWVRAWSCRLRVLGAISPENESFYSSLKCVREQQSRPHLRHLMTSQQKISQVLFLSDSEMMKLVLPDRTTRQVQGLLVKTILVFLVRPSWLTDNRGILMRKSR